jgi:hypothetical protein
VMKPGNPLTKPARTSFEPFFRKGAGCFFRRNLRIRLRKSWLGWKDSNLRMAGSKTDREAAQTLQAAQMMSSLHASCVLCDKAVVNISDTGIDS